MKIQYLGLILGTAIFGSFVHAGQTADLSIYPQTQTEQRRAVIHLAPKSNESDYSLQIVVGKYTTVDCNHQWYMGSLSAQTVSGWGYPYYVLKDVQGPAATLMACPKTAQKRAFVIVQGDGYQIPYNSRLPVVVYVPQGFEVKYRIWKADKTLLSAQMLQ